MRLKNILIVVEDIERSQCFYQDLFGLLSVRQFEGNVILTEGLVLQEKSTWEKLLGKQTGAGENIHAQGSLGNCAFELYFETADLEVFQQKLDNSGFDIVYQSRLTTYTWGQKVIRLYDPDGHLIEIGEKI